MSRFLRGETLVGPGRLDCTQSSGAQPRSVLCTWSRAVQGWPGLKAGLPVMKGSKTVTPKELWLCWRSWLGAAPCWICQHVEPALKGQSQGTGGDPWPGLGHLCVDSWVVTARTKPPSQWEDPWRLTGAGACGEGCRGVQMGLSFPNMWGLWLLHWVSELSFRQCWARSSSLLARGGWWGDHPFFLLHPPPHAAFYCSVGAYFGLSQCFGHADWFQKFVYLKH